jgi:hypothetical protein
MNVEIKLMVALAIKFPTKNILMNSFFFKLEVRNVIHSGRIYGNCPGSVSLNSCYQMIATGLGFILSLFRPFLFAI